MAAPSRVFRKMQMPSLLRPLRTLLVPERPLRGRLETGRRGLLGGLLALPFAPLVSGAAGCAALAGEETIDAFFMVGKNAGPGFNGWSEYNLDEAPDPDQAATLERIMLNAPDGAKDLTFITEVFAEAVQPDGTRTPIASGSNFPKNDTIAAMDILFDGNLRNLLYPDGKKLRVEWEGKFDPTYPYPEGGARVNAQVIIEIL